MKNYYVIIKDYSFEGVEKTGYSLVSVVCEDPIRSLEIVKDLKLNSVAVIDEESLELINPASTQMEPIKVFYDVKITNKYLDNDDIGSFVSYRTKSGYDNGILESVGITEVLVEFDYGIKLCNPNNLRFGK